MQESSEKAQDHVEAIHGNAKQLVAQPYLRERTSTAPSDAAKVGANAVHNSAAHGGLARRVENYFLCAHCFSFPIVSLLHASFPTVHAQAFCE